MDIFSTREIAIALWSVGLLTWGMTKPNFRKSFLRFARAFFVRPIMIVFGLMTAYVVAMVLALHHFDLWNVRQIKDTVLWAVFVGSSSMFRLTAISREKSYFIDTIKDNLKLIVFIEFVVTYFVFPLLAELVIVPVTTGLALMLVFSEREEKFNAITKFLNNVMLVLGLGLMTRTLYKLISDFSGFANAQTLADFSLTPILTICFFPFLFLAARYEHHERFALRLKQAVKDPAIYRYAYWHALFRFKASVATLDRWAISLFSLDTQDRKDIDRSIDRILAMVRAERKPPLIPFNSGWSPYEAKNFLKEQGLKTGYYTSYDDREWYSSATKDIAKRALNTIEYMIEGDRDTVTRLKLTLTSYETEPPVEHRQHFLELFKSLYEQALRVEVPDASDDEKPDQRWIVGNREIIVKKDNWIHREGYELEIRIDVIDDDGNPVFEAIRKTAPTGDYPLVPKADAP